MRLLRIALATLVLLGLMSAPVAARRRTFASNLTRISEQTDGEFVVAISGRVTSRQPKCVSGREIRVRLEGADIFYGAATTDANGNFTVEGTGPRDQLYRISLLKAKIGGSTCGPDTVVDELG